MEGADFRPYHGPMQIPAIGFHESSIIGFRSTTDALTLDLEGVLLEGQKQTVSIKLEGLRDLTRDGQRIAAVQMEAEDGEVLTLELSPNRLYMVCEWNDFRNRKRHTRSYTCDCDALQVEVQ